MFQSRRRECRTRVPIGSPMDLLKQIDALFRTGTSNGLTDGQLLDRFLERRGEDAEAAFTALVDRHGATVLRVCRQIVRGEEDAEDAAQATFLVLARRAASINRRESIACWLHGIAPRCSQGTNRRLSPACTRAPRWRNAERPVIPDFRHGLIIAGGTRASRSSARRPRPVNPHTKPCRRRLSPRPSRRFD